MLHYPSKEGFCMLIYAIDSNSVDLHELCDAISIAIDGVEIRTFSKAHDLLDVVKSQDPYLDMIFTEVCLSDKNGLELVAKIKSCYPGMRVIIVTKNSDYAMDAFKSHANGYMIKPIKASDIKDELYYQRFSPPMFLQRLYIRCFGNFEVFWKGNPLRFRRRRTKELLAYLVDRNGAVCTAEELIAVLWEDASNLINAKHNIRNLVSDLRNTLSDIGQESVLIRGSGTVAINRNAVECDYYKMLDGNISAKDAYRGEYMNQYHWAQFTEGKLFFNNEK